MEKLLGYVCENTMENLHGENIGIHSCMKYDKQYSRLDNMKHAHTHSGP